MKSRFLSFVLLVFCQIGFAQTQTNTIYGQVLCDSIRIESGDVINLNLKLRVDIKKDGLFTIPAKVNDTLIFLGLAFHSKKIVLTRNDLSARPLKVKLVADITKLHEVTVEGNVIKPNLDNSQKYVDQKYFDDEKSSPKNPIYQPSGTFENQADFVRMYKDLKKLLKKKEPESDQSENQFTFIETVLNTYNSTFFTESLGIKEDDIMLFLIYCDNDPASKKFLQNHTKFELTNYLTNKNDEFKKFEIVEK